MGSATTSGREPSSSRAPSSRSRFSSSAAWFGSAGCSSRQSTMVRASVKRARSSTWPWVSSPAMPRPSQMVCARAEHLGEDLLVVGAAEAGVAHLHRGVEQALLGGEHRAAPVHVDGAPLQHHLAAAVGHRQERHLERPGGPLRDAGVAPPVGVLGPGVEPEAGDGPGRGVAAAGEPDGAVVAGPDPVGGEAAEVDRLERHAGPAEQRPHLPLVGRVEHREAHRLLPGHLADDLGVDPGDGGEAARPVRARCAARRARWPRAGPTPPAWRSPGPPARWRPWRSIAEPPNRGRRRRRCAGRGGRASGGAPPRCARGPPRRPAISSRSVEASATTTPNGSHRKVPPQNSRPAGLRRLPLVPDPVDRRHVAAVGDGVAPLDGLPGVALGRAELGLLGRVPADGGRVEEDLGAGQGGQAGAPRGTTGPSRRACRCGRSAVSTAWKPRSPGVK